jgi:tRNA uridine 5-carbamoylmethylation protein Kti12
MTFEVVKFPKITEQIIYRKRAKENAPILHQVSIPESYIRRANGGYERENKSNQEVIQRLLRNFQESRQAR